MTFQKHPNGLSPRPRHELALDRFWGDQPHRPARSARRRIAARHGEEALLLGGLQQGSGRGPLFFLERPLEPSLLVAAADRAHRLGGELNMARHLGSGWAGVALEQGQRPQHGAHGLDPLTVALGEANGKATVGAHGLL